MIGYQVAQGTGHIYKDTRGRIAVTAYVDGTATDASGLSLALSLMKVELSYSMQSLQPMMELVFIMLT